MNGEQRVNLVEREITHNIIGAFYEVHNQLGFGFLESVYVAALMAELKQRHVECAREVDVRVAYKGLEIARHRIDLLVARRVIVEVKAGAIMLPAAQRQLRNYLRATSLEVGLLLNFGQKAQFSRVFVPNQRVTTVPT